LLPDVRTPTIQPISAAGERQGPQEGEGSMKKLLVILILAAIGIAVAKKVREA
jgi:hypothetical protein